MSQYSITLAGNQRVFEADATFELEDGSLTTAEKLLVGDRVKIMVHDNAMLEEVEAVERVPTLEECVESKSILEELRLAALESRIETLEQALITNNQIVQGLQRTIVELTAHHVEAVFSNDVMLDTLAQRLFITGANAIAHKAKQSRNRAPKLVVIDSMIPGVTLRATLNEENVAQIEMLDKTGTWVSGEELPEEMRSEAVINTFGNLLLAHHAAPGRAYFITEDVALEEYREQVAAEAQAVVKGVVEQPNAVH
jgi:hypothetical protein